MKYIERHMEKLIIELSKSYSAILLTGPRQAGKTTLLQQLAEKENIQRKYVSLDDFSNREIAKNDPALFLQLHKPPILIDEVQYAPELFSYIKIHIDEHHNPGDFWLTGSQIYRLMRGVQESLAGRVALLHLSPLSQREITGNPCIPFSTDFNTLLTERDRIKPISAPELYSRLWNGSMPGLISGQYPDRNIFYSSYISSYIERDVRDISGTINALKFNRFVTAAAARCSQLLNYNALAEDAEIDIPTAKNWMNILETLGIIFLLHPYSNNVLKRTIKTPKLYFYDTGLVCYLTKWSSPETTAIGAMNGALLENFAISEIMKSYQNAGQEPYLYFYRDRDAKEIDAILERDGKLCPLEIKKTSSPDTRLTRVFRVIDKSPLEKGTGAILCLANEFGAIDRNNLIVPIWMI
ncbi:MAG: ATP-binding protein [Anaerolineaceae bacterium]|nr:ATP-binding protein [Anaerolineaceae bacterium]